MPSPIQMRVLLETGVHFGHRTTKWNPKMAPFIFTARNGIHIIDLRQTLDLINDHYDMVRDIVANGGDVLFVGTKRQAQEIVTQEAKRCGMPYVSMRWLGGTLTNWRTIRERIDTLKKLEQRRDEGEFDLLSKKESLTLERKIEKLQLRLGGVREMKRLPQILVIVDTAHESTAVKEANVLDIPIVGIVDTNGDPDLIDHIIPANDDAMRSIKLLVSTMAEAVIEGKQMRGKLDEEFVDETATLDSFDEDVSDEELLGASTLAKLRDATLFEDDEEAAEDTAEDVVEETETAEEADAAEAKEADEAEAESDEE